MQEQGRFPRNKSQLQIVAEERRQERPAGKSFGRGQDPGKDKSSLQVSRGTKKQAWGVEGWGGRSFTQRVAG